MSGLTARIQYISAALGVALSLYAGAAAAETYHVLGMGNVSCGRWLQERRNSTLLASAYVGWVQGFLTAYNNYEAVDGDITHGADVDGLSAWVDNYCQAHPLDDLAHAAKALVDELKVRKH